MHPLEVFFPIFDCSSIPELYSKLENIAKDKMEMHELPFPLSDLVLPRCCKWEDITYFIVKCARHARGDESEAQVKRLVEILKDNHPNVNNGNPKLSTRELTLEERNLIRIIFLEGIDLPGSKYNLYGNIEYYSSFFMDMFFGNFTKFMDHVNSLSNEELKIELEKREGYCQFSPLFAPVLGIKLAIPDLNPAITFSNRRDIKLKYPGNESRHMEILRKVLELGADPNSHDMYGFTPLHHALHPTYLMYAEPIVACLLQYGANPNSENILGDRPLSLLRYSKYEFEMNLIEKLLNHDAKVTRIEEANLLRTAVESFKNKDLVVKVREAMPRDDNECEKCAMPAERKCSACKIVWYCSPVCQRLDWVFHKVSCKKYRVTV